MVFENRILYDRAAAQALVDVSRRGPQRRRLLLRRIIVLAVGLLALVCGSLPALFFSRLETYGRVLCVTHLILGVLLIRRGMLFRRVLVRRVMRGMTEGERRVRFTEEEFQVEQPGVQRAVFYYSAVTSVWETEGYFALPLSTGSHVLLDKGGFVQGTVAEFRGFIQQRTGKAAQFIG